MSSTAQYPGPASQNPLFEKLGRMLRHEMGDFLQKVYASVAILKGRLPTEFELERQVLTRLRNQAESCTRLLDAIQDFLCPICVSFDKVNLAVLSANLLSEIGKRYPQREASVDSCWQGFINGDAGRLTQVGESLLDNACAAAQNRVTVTVAAPNQNDFVAWVFSDDGLGVSPDDLPKLFTPFFTTSAGHAGLGLAMARKIIDQHGGTISGENSISGGFRVTIQLPVAKS